MTAETIIQSPPFFVIASEAKQSMLLHKERMDCFVASLLAMTGIDGGASDLRRRR
ncbi:hypothetical protein [Bradyrhizobium lablabi]|uniref:hypothetical protein n=1 Tax=Bradyrhizobium lablabi TaxID=722472 RepID=UPI00090A4077|nr:hypothetical protein [Bradyrhizobium lablabi]SHL95846.1 hypothetical protein SAMN05444321_4715 [Bradyrhizobium lablabi]